MNKINTIVFCKEDYKTEQEWKDAVRDAVFLLLNAQYQMVVRYDEPGLGIICVDFESSDETLGSPWPYWLTPDQAEHLIYTYNEAGSDDEPEDVCEPEPDTENFKLPETVIASSKSPEASYTLCNRDVDQETTEATPTAQKVFDEFWKPLVSQSEPNANFLNENAVKNELADYYFLMKQVPRIYSTVTGGVLSKTGYEADTVIKVFYENYGNIAEQARLLPDDWDLVTAECKTNEDYKKVVMDYLKAED